MSQKNGVIWELKAKLVYINLFIFGEKECMFWQKIFLSTSTSGIVT